MRLATDAEMMVARPNLLARTPCGTTMAQILVERLEQIAMCPVEIMDIRELDEVKVFIRMFTEHGEWLWRVNNHNVECRMLDNPKSANLALAEEMMEMAEWFRKCQTI